MVSITFIIKIKISKLSGRLDISMLILFVNLENNNFIDTILEK